MDYRIRPMEEKDLDEIVRAEGECYSHPWSAEIFRRELANPVSRLRLLHLDGQPAAYLCAWYLVGELHIHNIATRPPFRRQGLAIKLLRGIIDECRETGLERVFLEVRVGNIGAIALYRAFGFREAGRRKGYYPDGEDALLMELEIADIPDIPV
ncbi:ribosomal protein S18-alanine N-acetyltransferase [Trichloromonas sp.]|uniref:ribosomal protein S18-alanine N-acetyltransferase n=1 Tax=Trichloromonas sp. TaxID=3069249 RepID=UPI002A432EE2|nr:ribosomal protein S18-alanine N-acetyltransferase [Trichloromonas sp.]